jgi:hypothetical protein
MIPLFGEPEADGKRDVLEGRLLSLALEALRLGTNVILDLGCWSRDERSAIRWLVESAGASCDLVYVPVDLETQRARIAHRQSTTPDQTFPMSEADLLHWRPCSRCPTPRNSPGMKSAVRLLVGRAGPSGSPIGGPLSGDCPAPLGNVVDRLLAR